MKKYLFSTLFFLVLLSNSVAGNSSHGDFRIKGFHLDLRNEVMKMTSMKEYIKKLSANGINTLIVEWEDTFPYENHLPIRGRYSYSRDEVKDFIAYCNDLGIDVIPLQQTFGHVEYILRHERYSSLREDGREFSQICPLNPSSLDLFSELIDDMISLSTSNYVHIGCDETRLLGSCRNCKAFVEKHGVSKLFTDYVKKTSQMVVDKGKTPVMWADILLKYPDHAHEIPKEAIFVDWNYGDQPRHVEAISDLQKKGFTFWGATAMRSGPDNLYLTDWKKHFGNQLFYIPFAKENNFDGIIMTSWSTSGQFSYIWDYPSWDLLHLEEIRNVYPIEGFNILLEFYANIVNSSLTSLPNEQEFIKKYGQKQFGFTDAESETFLHIFSIEPYIINGNKISRHPSLLISDVNIEYKKVQNTVNKLKPRKNKKEFEHLKLMVDMRSNYLDFKEFEQVFNSEDVTIRESKQHHKALSSIKKEADRINKRFIRINKKGYYESELAHLNDVRSKKLMDLYYKIKQLLANK